MDAEGVFSLVLNDPEFAAHVEQLTNYDAVQGVSEAMNVLHEVPAPGDTSNQYDISVEACLAITVLEQWLVRYLCKRLMQLMTSEALILHRRKIPSSYLESYLSFDVHFSLKELINKHYEALRNSGR